MNTYGIPAPIPSPDVVDSHLAINNDNLIAVAQALPARVDDALTVNDGDLSKVVGTLLKSVDGKIAANSKILTPVVTALQSHVDAMLGANDGILSSLPDSIKTPALKAVPAATVNPPTDPTATPFTLPGTYIIALDPATGEASILPSEQTPPAGSPLVIVGTYPTLDAVYSAWQTRFPGVPVPTVGALINTNPPPPTNTNPQGGQQGATTPTGTDAGTGGTPANPYPIPGSGTLKWYCAGPYSGDSAGGVGQPQGGNVAIQADPTSLVYNYSNNGYQTTINGQLYVIFGGPFDTKEQVSSVGPCMGGSTAPPPPPQPPPPLGYYCVVKRFPDGTRNTGVVSSSELPDFQAQGWSINSGPYETKSEAQAACPLSDVSPPAKFVCQPVALPNLPNWCDTDVCSTIDSVLSSLTGLGALDLFSAFNAGTLDNPAPDGTWLASLGNVPVAGSTLQSVIETVLCKVSGFVNTAIAGPGSQVVGLGAVGLARLIVGFFNKFLGAGLDDTYRKLDYAADYLSPTIIPNVGEADALLQQGFITADQWRCWVRANNVCDTTHALVTQSGLYRPDYRTAERLYRSGDITDTEYDRILKWNRITDDRSAEIARASYASYPTISDVIRFMVRDVWDEAVSAAGQYDTDFDAKLSGDAAKYIDISGTNRDIAKLYWRAHWVLPSTSQAYEMLHRLRPGRVDPSIVFTTQDAVKLLKVNDHAPGYIDRLIAVSYRPLPVRALRTLFDTGQIDAREVSERYQDMGYSPSDGGLFAAQEETLKRRRVASQTKGWTPSTIARAYSTGAVDGARAAKLFVRLGYSEGDASEMMDAQNSLVQAKLVEGARRRVLSKAIAGTLKAYEVGAIDQQTANLALSQQGIPSALAPGLLASVDLTVQTGLARQAVTAVRSAVRRGELTADQAAQQLQGLGIAPDRIRAYIASWVVSMSAHRRQLTASQVMKAVAEGILTSPQAIQRLTNLGFPEPDIEVLLAEITYQINTSQARAKLAADKQRSRAASQLLAQSQRLAKTQETIAKQLCRKTPPSVLIRWFAKQLIDVYYFTESLKCQGYTPSQIEGLLSDAQDALTKRQAKGQTSSPAQSPLPYDQSPPA